MAYLRSFWRTPYLRYEKNIKDYTVHSKKIELPQWALMQAGSRTCPDLGTRPHHELRRTIAGSHVETVRISLIAAAVSRERNRNLRRRREETNVWTYAHFRRWFDVPVQQAVSCRTEWLWFKSTCIKNDKARGVTQL